MIRSRRGLCSLLLLLCNAACDDAQSGPIGGLLFVIDVDAAVEAPLNEVERLEIIYNRVEASIDVANSSARSVVLDTQERTLVLDNVAREGDQVVAQFQVPVGTVSQLRFFPKAVALRLRDGTSVILDAESADLPSWRRAESAA